ncbi:hypothetical protein [Phreatobacter stygius]|uniref:DUF2259 domain-containing protein n=1 Tax=Phreatobacter stygius TaxID=1940610 RepID=A0A4D7AX07_9HYPH|nr:hypothetical protein [Phreatobacter stygius]QCI64591.1 hypothetical protein E8M01_10330 [Phreatobacter stygius]
MSLRPIILAALALLALATPGAARELGTAPDLRILGFSSDGRYFGFEQEGGDGASQRGAFAVDVVDRTTGLSATGFPRGATQLSWQATPADARHAAMRGFRFDEDDEASMQTPAIRRWTQATTRRPLRRLGLTEPGRRLAGRTWTDLTRMEGPVRFMADPDIIGAHPGLSTKYAVVARLTAPDDPNLACRERETAATYPLAVTLTPELPSWDPEAARRSPETFRERTIELTYMLPPMTCATSVHITDVYRNRASTTLAVVVLIIADSGHSDSAEYRAVMFPMR